MPSKRKPHAKYSKPARHAADPFAKLAVRRASEHGAYGWVPDIPDTRDFLYGAPLFHFPKGLPAAVDLRSNCPPIYDQGQLGSCTGNGIAAAIEFDQRKQGKKEFAPSPEDRKKVGRGLQIGLAFVARRTATAKY